MDSVHLFEDGQESNLKQEVHTLEAALIVANELKTTLQNLAQALFGKG